MTRALPALLCLAVALGAWYLREAHRPGYEEPQAEGAELYIDDPDAAYHLRRVELALASGRVPSFDRFLSHPDGSPVPWPPFLDAALAAVSRHTLVADPSGHDVVDERKLQRFLAGVPPLLGAVACLAIFLATRAFVRGESRSRAWAGLLAAALYAASPIAVWYGGVTRVDHHVLVAVLFALQLALVGWAVSTTELVDATLGAIFGGIVAGIALLTWLASALFVLLCGGAFLLRALDSNPDRARDGERGGALFFLVAALATLVPASESPWNEVAPGSLVNLTNGVPNALFLAAVCFVALHLPVVRRSKGLVRAGVFALVGVLGVILLPGFLDGVREGLRWASRDNLFMDVVDESRPLLMRAGELDPWSAARDLSPLVFAFPLFWLMAWRGWRRPERLLLLASGALFLILTLNQRRFGNAFAVPYAITVAAVLHDGFTASRRPRLWVAAGVLVAIVGSLGAYSVLSVPKAELDAVREWRSEVVGGLRRMRELSPSPGPYNAARAQQDYGVLSAWGLGHLIEYHARRPTITTNFGSFVSETGFRGAHRALLSDSPESFGVSMRSLGARYVIVTPRQAGDLKSLARIAGRGGEGWFKNDMAKARGTALWRLALTPVNSSPDHYPGLERVWASSLRESTRGGRARQGELDGPVLSIYRLLPRDVVPSMSPMDSEAEDS